MKISVEFYNHWKRWGKWLWYITFFEVNGSFDDKGGFVGLTILNFEFNIFFLKKR